MPAEAAGRKSVPLERDATRASRAEETDDPAVGLYAPTGTATTARRRAGPRSGRLARDAERLGVDTVWVADEPGFWECWTILTALAEADERIGIGPLVACTRYRIPALLVTMVRALDEVSGGRADGRARQRSAARSTSDGRIRLGRHVTRREVRRGGRDLARLSAHGPTRSTATSTHRGARIGPGGCDPGRRRPIWVAARRAAHDGDRLPVGRRGGRRRSLADRAAVADFRADVERRVLDGSAATRRA